MAQLIDGAVATGEGAFHPGQQVARAPSPDWPVVLPDNDEDNKIDPYLKGPAGRVDPPTHTPKTPDSPVSSSRPDENSDMEEVVVLSSSASCRRVRAMSESPQSNKRRRTDGHGRKPSNGHAMMAVSESLKGIAAALTADNTGPSSPQRKTNAIKLIMKIPELLKEEKTQILRLIRADTGIADTFLAIEEEDAQSRIDYLRAELEQ
ncbi:hypothetical protein B0H19DRAFT_1325579 [Mycena capillaripes]|nr:hypothetical protein B0H19DRAFT_1325579 [Mycena capillaripes]